MNKLLVFIFSAILMSQSYAFPLFGMSKNVRGEVAKSLSFFFADRKFIDSFNVIDIQCETSIFEDSGISPSSQCTYKTSQNGEREALKNEGAVEKVIFILLALKFKPQKVGNSTRTLRIKLKSLKCEEVDEKYTCQVTQ